MLVEYHHNKPKILVTLIQTSYIGALQKSTSKRLSVTLREAPYLSGKERQFLPGMRALSWVPSLGWGIKKIKRKKLQSMYLNPVQLQTTSGKD